jgi:hypothetical protein
MTMLGLGLPRVIEKLPFHLRNHPHSHPNWLNTIAMILMGSLFLIDWPYSTFRRLARRLGCNPSMVDDDVGIASQPCDEVLKVTSALV